MHQILHHCTRVVQHSLHRRLLISACTGYTGWDRLLNQAETEGMGPLLFRHLSSSGVDLPEDFSRKLRFIKLRHQQANTILAQGLHDILGLLKTAGIPSLVLKGAALCHTLYPQIGLRPMRDIDLLVARKDVYHAHEVLQKQGFTVSTTPIPEDHFHLKALSRTINGLQVCIELHHGLYAPLPPYNQSPSFSKLFGNAVSFDIEGEKAYTLKTEEMLVHLYHHGFHAPLTYEPYKLISVADIIGLVEKEVETIDWDEIRSVSPRLFHALPYFHYITPWTERVLAKIPFKKRAVPSGVGAHFDGWPQLRLSRWKGERFSKMLRHTFFPARWWMLIYYSYTSRLSPVQCRYIRHWNQIFWWIKLYGHYFYKATLKKKNSPLPEKHWAGLLWLRKVKTIVVAIYRQFK